MHPKQGTTLHRLHRVAVIPTAYIKSGHLLPLPADGAEADFSHIFRTAGPRASLCADETRWPFGRVRSGVAGPARRRGMLQELIRRRFIHYLHLRPGRPSSQEAGVNGGRRVTGISSPPVAGMRSTGLHTACTKHPARNTFRWSHNWAVRCRLQAMIECGADA